MSKPSATMSSPSSSSSSSSEIGPNLLKQIVARQLQQRNPQAFQSHLFRERLRLARNLYKFDLIAHYGCVNAIEFSNGGDFLASGGDDKRILIWDVEKAIAGVEKPRVLDSEHTSNVFCLGFDRLNRKVFSGGNDDLVIVHDNETGKLHNVYKHEKPVYGLSIDPTCDDIFATACEDGQILVFDQRIDPADPLVVAKYRASFHAVQFHPFGGNYLVTANSKRGAAFWDIRKPHSPVIQYGFDESHPSYMSVRFNSFGNLILALRRRLPPILYNTFSSEPICQFYHPDYYNSCTMKSCTFAGEDDELVLSGSDDFNLYVWRVSDADLELTDQWIESTQMVLYGHRSIVNQVRYNREKCILASSGVEKIVKLWSPFNQKDWTGSLMEEATCSENPRDLFSPFTFPSLTPQSWSHMPHDYSSRNTNEDPRMMAFFDSLIQQEIEGWDTNNSSDSQLASDGGESTHSPNNSSIEDSDEQELLRYFVRKRERHRKNSILNKMKIQTHRYANRIAYLIATKRNTLRRLALKGASNSNRRPQRLNIAGRGTSHRAGANSRITHNSKRSGRGNHYGYRDRGQGPSGSGLTNSRRKKNKKQRRISVNVTSSDDDDQVPLPSNHLNVAIPSTSTGITSSGKDAILRLRQQQLLVEDSDEDDDDDEVIVPIVPVPDVSHIPIIPPRPAIKINGFGHAHDDSPQSPPPVQTRSNVNRRRKIDLDIYSSHSNSRLSNSSFLDETSSSSTDCNHHLSSKRRKFTNTTTNPVASDADAIITTSTTANNINNNNNNNNDSNHSTDIAKTSSNSINTDSIAAGTSSSFIEAEANNNNRSNSNEQLLHSSHHLLTPDSGISEATLTPHCSAPECRNPTRTPCDHNSGANSGNNIVNINLFQQKVSRVRRNYRKKFADESESD
ncbi:DDB1- and CUL4-associated factor 5 [Episyrphus balteatus]|uniref:DDB1- and CUL4-associated factor 5 n=1 Tax=Episyrphus balteatus TaxID=286459 RepID=UPI0024854C4F|nr:DDB1- and CUL4-associated factor 5 [Episyrphus balteatus]